MQATQATNVEARGRRILKGLLAVGLGAAVACSAACTIGDPGQAGTQGTTKPQPTLPTATPTIIASATAPETLAPHSDPAAASPQENRQGVQAKLESIVNEVQTTFGGQVGVAIASPEGIASAGTTSGIPAWSTIKVPIAIAALRNDPGQHANMMAAITVSDNEAAQALWDSLPSPKDNVQAVLAEAGDTSTVVNDQPLRPPFTVFGQTQWSLPDQVAFASNLACVANSAEVVQAMGQVDAGQSYGLGTLPQARFKGGWGPDTSGAYDARQFGIVSIAGVSVPVAIIAHAADGTYESAQVQLTALASKLGALDEPLAAAKCL